jgi:hypothetical protein
MKNQHYHHHHSPTESRTTCLLMILVLVIIGILYPIVRQSSHVAHPQIQKEILYASDASIMAPTTNTTVLEQIDSLNKKIQEEKEKQKSKIDLINFNGERLHEYDGEKLFLSMSNAFLSQRIATNVKPQGSKLSFGDDKLTIDRSCPFFGVVSTLNPPTAAIEKLVNINKQYWCVVIVGDHNGPKTYDLVSMSEGVEEEKSSSSSSTNFVYLSVEDQKKLTKQFPIINHLTSHHLSRKLIGYLYALSYRPQLIFDFDDDYSILSMKKTNNNLFHNTFFQEKTSPTTTKEASATNNNNNNNNNDTTTTTTPDNNNYYAVNVYELLNYNHSMLNIFPLLGANIHPSWPRGFPVNYLKETDTTGSLHETGEEGTASSPASSFQLSLQKREIRKESIGIIHTTANHFPDVDIIYKMVMPLPLEFPLRGHIPFLLPTSTKDSPNTPQVFAPFNAKSTLFFPTAYWSLFLPFSINNHMIDIYRAFITERILYEMNYRNAQSKSATGSEITTTTSSTKEENASDNNNNNNSSQVNNKNNNNLYSEVRILFHAPITIHNHKDLYNENNDNTPDTAAAATNPSLRSASPSSSSRSATLSSQLHHLRSFININNIEFLNAYSQEYSIYLVLNILIDELEEFIFCGRTIPGMLEEIYIHLYEIGLFNKLDILGLQMWLENLIQLGYEFPAVNENYRELDSEDEEERQKKCFKKKD